MTISTNVWIFDYFFEPMTGGNFMLAALKIADMNREENKEFVRTPHFFNLYIASIQCMFYCCIECNRCWPDRDISQEYAKEGVGEIPDNVLPLSLRGNLTKGLSSKPDERFEHVSELKKGLIEVYERQFAGYNGPEVKIDDSAERWFDRGTAFYILGRSISAEQPLKEALERYRIIPGTELEQAICTANLGTVYRKTDRYAEAEEAYGQALAIYGCRSQIFRPY